MYVLGQHFYYRLLNLQFVDLLEGVVEIWLTSEDTGAYGKDIGVTLPELLYQLVEVIPVGCMMRVGMTNPPYIQEYLKVKVYFLVSSLVSRNFSRSYVVVPSDINFP